jgi:hypothetical protein
MAQTQQSIDQLSLAVTQSWESAKGKAGSEQLKFEQNVAREAAVTVGDQFKSQITDNLAIDLWFSNH